MRASGEDLSALLISVRNDVMKATANKQIPWEHSSLTGRFYFKPVGRAPAPQVSAALPRSPATLDQAAEAWAAAKDSTSAVVLQAFIARFGSSFYAELAREPRVHRDDHAIARADGDTDRQLVVRRRHLSMLPSRSDPSERDRRANGSRR